MKSTSEPESESESNSNPNPKGFNSRKFNSDSDLNSSYPFLTLFYSSTFLLLVLINMKCIKLKMQPNSKPLSLLIHFCESPSTRPTSLILVSLSWIDRGGTDDEEGRGDHERPLQRRRLPWPPLRLDCQVPSHSHSFIHSLAFSFSLLIISHYIHTIRLISRIDTYFL